MMLLLSRDYPAARGALTRAAVLEEGKGLLSNDSKWTEEEIRALTEFSLNDADSAGPIP